jgi:hypothetical protein
VVAILFAMIGIVVLAGLVVLYVAYPHRGESVPNAPWLGEAMRKGVNRLPTVDNQRENQRGNQRENQRENQRNDQRSRRERLDQHR